MGAIEQVAAIWRPSTTTGQPVRFRLTPHQVQEDYFLATKRIVLDIAANRVGKTTAAMWDNIWRANGAHPYRNVPLINTLWSAFPDYPFYLKVTEPIFLRECPRSILVDWHGGDKHATIKRVDGGVCDIWFLSYEQDAASWAGAAVGHVHLDELPPKEHYAEAAARVSTTGGSIFITVTPVNGLGWLEEDLYLPGLTGENPDVEVLHGGLAVYDEALEKREPESMGVGDPLLPPTHPLGNREAVIAFARSYKDPAERMVRVFGIYKKRTGGVYGKFDPEVHVVPSFKVPRHWEVWGSVDPGFHGFAATLFAMSPMGRVYVAFELFSSIESTWTRVRLLWDGVLALLPWMAMSEEELELEGISEADQLSLTFFVDTAEQQEILELNERAAEIGARVMFTALDQRLKAFDAGVRRVQNFLEPSTLRATPPEVVRDRPEVGEPLLYLFDTLYSEWVHYRHGGDTDEGEPMQGSRLAWELKNYRWMKPKPHEAHSRGPDKQSAGGSHMADALRYGLQARLQPPEEKPKDAAETERQRRDRLHRERMAQQSQRQRRRG